METEPLKKALETLLFITDRPLSAAQLNKVTGAGDPEQVTALVAEIQREFEEKGSAIQVMEVAEGFQMATRKDNAPFVRKLFSERMTMRLSTAALETLSIVAYKQPLTRAEVEEIRGVEVIAALETLLEKRLLKVVGRKESVGRPLMYGTTMEFLRHFGLKSLEELPALESYEIPTPAALPQEQPQEQPQAAETSAQAPAEVPAETAVAVAEPETPQTDEPNPSA